MGIFNIKRTLPTTPEVLREVPHMGAYSSIMSPLVNNEMDYILEKVLMLVEGEEHETVGVVASYPPVCAC